MMIAAEGVSVPQERSGKDVRGRMFKRTSRKIARDSVRVEEVGRYQWAAQPGGLLSPPFVLLQRPRGPPSRNTPPFSLGRSRPCADQTNFTRLSPGVGCCFRAHSLARSVPLPSYGLVNFFPYRRPRYLSLLPLCLTPRLTEPGETPLPSFSRVSPTRCCVRAVKYA